MSDILNEDRKRYQRLLFWNLLWLVLVLLAALLWLASWEFSRLRASIDRVGVSWKEDGGLIFGSMSDGPFLITHVVDEHNTAVAQLPRLLTITESGNTELTKEEVLRLVWRERRTGEPVEPVKRGSLLRALYFNGRMREREP